MGITRFGLIFRKTSNIPFCCKRRYKIDYSKQVEISFYRGIGQQHGRVLRALAQIIGRTAINFWRKNIIPAAKHVGADLLEVAAPDIAEVFCCRKIFKIAAKSVGRQTLRKQLASGRSKKSASRVIPKKSAKLTSRPLRDVFMNLSQCSCQVIFDTTLLPFVTVSGNLRRKIPVVVVRWTKNLNFYLTWWELHRVWFSDGSELLRWFGFVAEICQGS